MLTLVTGLFLLRDRSIDVPSYLRWFDELAVGGMPILLFLDKELGWHDLGWRNVEVIQTRKEDLWAFQRAGSNTLELPAYRTVDKDTREFLLLQNAKLDMLAETFERRTIDHAAWIDFGVMKMVRDKHAFLTKLGRFEKPVAAPGCWDRSLSDISDREAVNWRFCGTFIARDRQGMRALTAAYQAHLSALITAGKITWEINVWAEIERAGLDFGWYPANHDDRLLP